MNQKDIIKQWFKELPPENPSSEFTGKVMKRVMSEWSLNPVRYQPMISRRGWWTHYYEGLRLKEIAAVLNVTESRVSQIHTLAIQRLRGHMERADNPLFKK